MIRFQDFKMQLISLLSDLWKPSISYRTFHQHRSTRLKCILSDLCYKNIEMDQLDRASNRTSIKKLDSSIFSFRLPEKSIIK